MASRAILHPDRDTDATRSVRILFAYPEEATFVRTDREILARFADVTSLCAPPGTRFETLAKALHGHDLAFIWFGLGHASRLVLAAKLLRKSTILVGGGWDVADMPEIGYGAARGTYGRVRAALTFALANRVLAFSRWSAEQVRAVSPRSRVEPLYLCVDTETWTPASKEPIALSIGAVTETNLRRKGLETFSRASRFVPEVQFVLVGRLDSAAADRLRSLGGTNFEMTGTLDDQSLRALAGRASVYVQVSLTEGFGLAVAEAMSAGCVPVVTRVAALPEVVNDCGLYVPVEDPKALAAAVRYAIGSSSGSRARERIRTRFPLRERENALRRIVSALYTS